MDTCEPINILRTLQSKSKDTTVLKLQGNLTPEMSLRLYDKEDLEKKKLKPSHMLNHNCIHDIEWHSL